MDQRRSVYINDLGINFANFEITDEQKLALIERGAKATRAYMENYTPPVGPGGNPR